MKFFDFLPYYSDLKAAGLVACAYVAALAGLILIELAVRIFKLKFGFEKIACFSFLASGLLWLLPILPFVAKEYSNLELLGVLIAYLPLMRFVYQTDWKTILIIWCAYAIAQISLYLYIINY